MQTIYLLRPQTPFLINETEYIAHVLKEYIQAVSVVIIDSSCEDIRKSPATYNKANHYTLLFLQFHSLLT